MFFVFLISDVFILLFYIWCFLFWIVFILISAIQLFVSKYYYYCYSITKFLMQFALCPLLTIYEKYYSVKAGLKFATIVFESIFISFSLTTTYILYVDILGGVFGVRPNLGFSNGWINVRWRAFFIYKQKFIVTLSIINFKF